MSFSRPSDVADLAHASLLAPRAAPLAVVNLSHMCVAASSQRSRRRLTCTPHSEYQHKRFTRLLPRVEPYYAVKCNPDPEILKRLVALGSKFDCASEFEVRLALSLGAAPRDILYANCVKSPDALKAATQLGVRRMTFDCAEELHKIAEACGGAAELLLRFAPDDSGAACVLSNKFGCDPAAHATSGLFALARSLGLTVVGVAYHVGSGGSKTQYYTDAALTARAVMDEGQKFYPEMRVVDIGGGFPAVTAPNATLAFDDIACNLRATLDDHFPDDAGYEIISEPGRFLVAASTTLFCDVVGVRDVPGGDRRIFLNDGTYGSFNCVYNDHIQFETGSVHLWTSADAFRRRARASPEDPGDATERGSVGSGSGGDGAATALRKRPRTTTRTSLWGPTCDGRDCISQCVDLPTNIEVGDVLYFPVMGAYTGAAGSTFNGMPLPQTVYLR